MGNQVSGNHVVPNLVAMAIFQRSFLEFAKNPSVFFTVTKYFLGDFVSRIFPYIAVTVLTFQNLGNLWISFSNESSYLLFRL